MKRILSLVLSLALFISSCAVYSSAYAASQLITVKYEAKEDYDEAMKIADMVNRERSKRGIAKLTVSKDLTKYAMLRAAELALRYSHTRPNGNRGSNYGSANNRNGENIAYGFYNGKEVMDAWMDSPGHKKNILKTPYKSIGIGCAEVNGNQFWVQVFGRYRTSAYSSKGTKTKTVSVKTQNRLNFFDTLSYDIHIRYQDFPDGVNLNQYYSFCIQHKGDEKTGWNNEYYGIIGLPIVREKDLKFESKKPKVLSVRPDGTATINKEGTAKVVVTHKPSGKKTTIKINTEKRIDVAFSRNRYTYDGKHHAPKVKIKRLIKDEETKTVTNYRYTYKAPKDATEIGTYKIKVYKEWDEKYTYTDYDFDDDFNLVTTKKTDVSHNKVFYLSKEYTIVPKGTKITKAKPKKKGIAFKWKKQTEKTDGYQLQVALDKNFTKGKKTVKIKGKKHTSKTVRSLKRNTKYYYRIRTYKTVKGKDYCSNWSDTGSVKSE